MIDSNNLYSNAKNIYIKSQPYLSDNIDNLVSDLLKNLYPFYWLFFNIPVRVGERKDLDESREQIKNLLPKILKQMKRELSEI